MAICACFQCRKSHKKCNNERPCMNCVKSKLDCYDIIKNSTSILKVAPILLAAQQNSQDGKEPFKFQINVNNRQEIRYIKTEEGDNKQSIKLSDNNNNNVNVNNQQENYNIMNNTNNNSIDNNFEPMKNIFVIKTEEQDNGMYGNYNNSENNKMMMQRMMAEKNQENKGNNISEKKYYNNINNENSISSSSYKISDIISHNNSDIFFDNSNEMDPSLMTSSDNIVDQFLSNEESKVIQELREEINSLKSQLMVKQNMIDQNTDNPLQNQRPFFNPFIAPFFVPYLTFKHDFNYMLLSFAKNLNSKSFHVYSMNLQDISTTLSHQLGYYPTQLKNQPLSVIAPFCSNQQLEAFSDHLVHKCEERVNYMKLITYARNKFGILCEVECECAVYCEEHKRPSYVFAVVKGVRSVDYNLNSDTLNTRFINWNPI